MVGLVLKRKEDLREDIELSFRQFSLEDIGY